MVTDSNSQTTSVFAKPWVQLVLGIICMIAVANLQYGWTNFVNPIDAKYHWGLAAIQVAFTIFVLVETWLVPVEGYLVDRYGPRPVVIVGGILVGLAWALNSVATRFPCCTSALALAASAPARCTVPASATRSSGFRDGAGSPPGSPRPASVQERRPPWHRSSR